MYGFVNVLLRIIKCVYWVLRKLVYFVLVRIEVFLIYIVKVESERENVCEVFCYENVLENIFLILFWM